MMTGQQDSYNNTHPVRFQVNKGYYLLALTSLGGKVDSGLSRYGLGGRHCCN